MLYALAGEPDVPPTPIPFGHAEPHGVYANGQEPLPAEMASLTGPRPGGRGLAQESLPHLRSWSGGYRGLRRHPGRARLARALAGAVA